MAQAKTKESFSGMVAIDVVVRSSKGVLTATTGDGRLAKTLVKEEGVSGDALIVG